MGLELEDQYNNEAEYLFSDNGKDNDTTNKGMYVSSDNNIADSM